METTMYEKDSLEPFREKMHSYVMTLPYEEKLDARYVNNIKGWMVNAFLGIINAVSNFKTFWNFSHSSLGFKQSVYWSVLWGNEQENYNSNVPQLVWHAYFWR